jgi:hypothetical protein
VRKETLLPARLWDCRTLLRFPIRIGTLPPVGALDRVRAANGDNGFVGRARSSPRLAIGAAVGALLLVAWIGWAIYVTNDHGARAGLGVVIIWPAMLAALAIISLPFIGGYLLIKRLSPSDHDGGTATAEPDTADDDDEDSDDEPEDPADDGEDEESESDTEDSSKG